MLDVVSFPNIVTIGIRRFSQAETSTEHGHYDTRSAGAIAPPSPVSGSTSTSASFSACLLPITVALTLLSNPSVKCATKAQPYLEHVR